MTATRSNSSSLLRLALSPQGESVKTRGARPRPPLRRPREKWPRASLQHASLVTIVAALALCACSTSSSSRERTTGGADGARIVTRIRLPVRPFAIATGAGSVWALSRAPSAALWRIDPTSNRLAGEPTRLPVDSWSLVVGGGSVWVTPNGKDGRLTRIDARSRKIVARISARPVYFGSAIAYGGGFIWTGNDDERYKGGSTVTKIDPTTNRVVGKPLMLGSPQSLAFGDRALWVADHTGWLFKIDPTRLKILAKRPLKFGPHGVVATGRAVYVADSHNDQLVEADPVTAKIRRATKLPVGPIFPAFGAGSLWSSSAAVWLGSLQDDRVIRIDPKELAITETIHLGHTVVSVAFGFGSLWAALDNGQVVRVSATNA